MTHLGCTPLLFLYIPCMLLTVPTDFQQNQQLCLVYISCLAHSSLLFQGVMHTLQMAKTAPRMGACRMLPRVPSTSGTSSTAWASMTRHAPPQPCPMSDRGQKHIGMQCDLASNSLCSAYAPCTEVWTSPTRLWPGKVVCAGRFRHLKLCTSAS